MEVTESLRLVKANYGSFMRLPLRHLVMRGRLHGTICKIRVGQIFAQIEWHSGKYHL